MAGHCDVFHDVIYEGKKAVNVSEKTVAEQKCFLTIVEKCAPGLWQFLLRLAFVSSLPHFGGTLSQRK